MSAGGLSTREPMWGESTTSPADRELSIVIHLSSEISTSSTDRAFDPLDRNSFLLQGQLFTYRSAEGRV